MAQNDSNIHTVGDAESIDYEQIEQAVINALNEHDNSKYDSIAYTDDVVSFATDTDASYYTVEPVVAPTTSAQQSTAILYDIRNLIILFFLTYVTLSFYRMLKTTINQFMGG